MGYNVIIISGGKTMGGRVLITILSFLFAFPLIAQEKISGPPQKVNVEFRNDRILVKFKEVVKIPNNYPSRTTGPIEPGNNPYERILPPEAVEALAKINGKILWIAKTTNIAIVSIPQNTVGKAIETLYKSGVVEYAEPDYKVYATQTIPNDPYFPRMWNLNDVDDTDIDAPEAWDISTNGTGVLVGVVDTGVDYNHEDLHGNMWQNPNEIPGNNIDDDGNGWIDDIYGVDCYNMDGDPMDDNGHGTHVAGTIGAIGNNGIGVVGVAWNAKIVALKFLNADGWGYVSDAICAMEYFRSIMQTEKVNKGILNASWGGHGYSRALYDEIKALMRDGVLFIAAAGNNSDDTDIYPEYPAAYNLPNIISVCASDTNDERATFSNYGTSSVDLCAPGVYIWSTIPGNNYDAYSGTSMATPHVTGAAAVLWTKYPRFNWKKIKALILNGVDKPSGLANTSLTEGRLNLYNSLTVDPRSPAIFSVKPKIADRGDRIIIKGINFGSSPGQVLVNGKPLKIVKWSKQKIIAQIPSKIAYGKKTLKVVNSNGKESIDVWFTVGKIPVKVGETLIGHAWASAVQVGYNLWIFGGGTYWGQTGLVERCTLDVEPICVINSAWTMPKPLTNTSAILFNNEVWIVGGLDWDTFEYSDKIQIFNPSTGTWRMGPTLPEPLLSPGLFVYNGKLYVVGGERSDGTISNKVYIYDPITNKWTTGADKPTAVDKAITVRKGNTSKFVVAGGFTSIWCGTETSITEIYDASKDEWTIGPNMNIPRGGAAGIYAGGVYALMGNCVNSRSDGEVLKRGKWKIIVYGHRTRYTPMVGKKGKYVYIFGGYDFSSWEYISSIVRYKY